MTTINLKDFYYWYTQDQFIEVTEEVAEALRASVRYEAAYQRRLTRHKAQYSLDCEDGICGAGRHTALIPSPSSWTGSRQRSWWKMRKWILPS